MKHALNANGQVVEVFADVVEIEGQEVALADRYHADFLAQLVPCPEDTFPGYTFDGEQFAPPPATPTPSDADVRAQRDAMLAQALLRVAPLQYAVDLKDATDDEKASLKAWKQYSVALNRIEAQTGFPGDVEWPVAPA